MNFLERPGKVLLKRAEKYDEIVGGNYNEVYLASQDRYHVKRLTPSASQKIYNHSPDGFAWGYNGSGPSQAALAILLELYGKKIAVKYYQDFKSEVISTAPRDYFTLRIKHVEEWLVEKKAAPVFDKLKKEIQSES